MRKKKTDKEIESKEKKSRAKYERPGELGELIDQVNLVPPDFLMQSIILLLMERKYTETEALEICLKDTSEKFQQHIKKVADEKVKSFYPAKPHMETVYKVGAMVNEYARLYDLRMMMRMLVDRLERERKGEITPEHWLAFPLTPSATIFRGKDGKLQKSDLLAVVGNFDDSRLRSCEICNCIFWAENKNSFTCSETCRNALRQRRYRKKNKEDVNAKRRERYQQEKQKKESEKEERKKALLDKCKKEQNNGTL